MFHCSGDITSFYVISPTETKISNSFQNFQSIDKVIISKNMNFALEFVSLIFCMQKGLFISKNYLTLEQV